MRVTNATWDDVLIFGTALLICIGFSIIYKFISMPFSSSERKSFKYGSPRDLIGYNIFNSTQRGLEVLGEFYSETTWQFQLYRGGKKGYLFDFDIKYEQNNIIVLIKLKIGNNIETKNLTCSYDKNEIQNQIKTSMDNLLATHKDYLMLE
jgi:hypothetical protein